MKSMMILITARRIVSKSRRGQSRRPYCCPLSVAAGLLSIAPIIFIPRLANSEVPQQIVQEAVNAETAANKTDQSNWIYLEEIRKPKDHILQWVSATQQGTVIRVFLKNEQSVDAAEQRRQIDNYLKSPGEQKKQLAVTAHDLQQVNELMALLPVAFIWSQTGLTQTTITLHFEPNPAFHPPTREARVFSSMVGDLVIDSQQHRIESMSGRLMRDVAFGGGLLGKLKVGSSFHLEQAKVGPSNWQLTAIDVHLEGNAFLFKGISLQQDDTRSKFGPEPPTLNLNQAAELVMRQQQ